MQVHPRQIRRVVPAIFALIMLLAASVPALTWSNTYCGHGISNYSSTQRIRYDYYWNDPQPGVIYHFHRYAHEDWELIGPSTWGWAYDHPQDKVCDKF